MVSGCFLIGSSFLVSQIQARVTPADLVNSQQASFTQMVQNYSQNDQRKLQALTAQIAQINKQRTDQLAAIMLEQGLILDEYQKRHNYRSTPQIDTARYWITYAHEAVAYQAAKIYIFNLTGEANLKLDASFLINLFQSDLGATRNKVIHSQQVLESILQP